MARGQLRLYLGAAPGVGKTYAMLNEGWRRKHRGTDVVVGFVEAHGRPTTAAQVRDLEVIPRFEVSGVEEMDVEAVLARHPRVVLVDEIAHANAPGAPRAHRWQDVDVLLEAGIDVISTLNVQHLESLSDVIAKITGGEQGETIPDAVVRAADQIELVDMTPEALQRRMAHGNVFRSEEFDGARANFFRVGNLAAVRELALLWMADRVEEGLAAYRELHGISATWETRERVVVAMDGRPGADVLIRRAARIAGRVTGDLVAIHVRHTRDPAPAPSTEVDRQKQLVRELGGTYREVVAEDTAAALVRSALAENATQLVVGSTRRSRLSEVVRGSVLTSIIRATRGELDVHVIPLGASGEAESASGAANSWVGSRGEPAGRGWARVSPLSARRIAVAVAVGAATLPALTSILAGFRSDLGFATDLILYLITVVAVALIGGVLPGLGAAVGAFLLLNYYFTAPHHTFTISGAQDISALIAFVVVAATVSLLVDLVSRRAGEARRARMEAGALADTAGSLLRVDYSLDELAARLLATFRLDGVSVLHGEKRWGSDRMASRNVEWTAHASAGPRAPSVPGDADLVLDLSFDDVLALAGHNISEGDGEVLRAFAAQLALALESRRVQAELSDKALVERANELRKALLAAVSHDLRTPLASIKTAATSLLADDIRWDRESTGELLRTIDAETDRLNWLVGNLLDMGRLQSNTVPVIFADVGPGCDVSLGDVVERAVTGCSADRIDGPARSVEVDVPEGLPVIRSDPALLERAVANLVANALAFSPPGGTVQVSAEPVAERIDVRIVDAGPGIPLGERENVFQPFLQLDGRGRGTGVGLGLAVARGFVDALGGELSVEDTPGGGATMVISLPCVRP